MFKNISDILFVWAVNAVAIIGTSQDVANNLNIVESVFKIAVLIATLIFTCYKIKKARKESNNDTDDE